MKNLTTNTSVEYTLYPQGGKRETITETLGEIIQDTLKYSIHRLDHIIEEMEKEGTLPEGFDVEYFNVEALIPALSVDDIAHLVQAHPKHVIIND